MGKIFCLMGKSASGKDTVYRRLLALKDLNLRNVVPYTTRPIRQGERDGDDYFFKSDAEASALEQEGRIIELRTYHTVHGIWKYFTADDGQIRLDLGSYLLIGTPASCISLRKHFGRELVYPLCLRVDDGVRLWRALERERAQSEPKYAELCRRYLADEEDFSNARLALAGVRDECCFENETEDTAVRQISEYITGILN